MIKATAISSSLILSAMVAVATPAQFDFKDPKGINNVSFQLDAPLESVSGNASGVSGSVTYDSDSPASLKGKIVVATASMKVPNTMQNGHLLGKDWMDAEKFPEIAFEVEKVENLKPKGNATSADVTGKMTIKGVTKTMTVPVTLTYLKDKIKDRGGFPGKNGDILVVRSEFTVKRGDFGINTGKMEEKVANDIAIKLSLAGFAPR
jgi:polyisoprenoid-binding protein YceI